MANLKYYIQAARLRTLPLSISGIIVGSGFALLEEKFNSLIFVFSLLATISFQILSNFANDYGDGIKGTDDQREGEKRLIASGLISPKQMLNAILITSIISLTLVISLIYVSFGSTNLIKSIVFLFLGISSIIAAIKYTVGKSAYGYSGFGDVFVFFFFGILSVFGTYYLFTKNINNVLLFLPASSIGFLSVAVLNLNNMRDQIQDKKANKNTLVVKLGPLKSKKYHYLLILISLFLFVVFRLSQPVLTFKSWLFLIAYIPLVINIYTVYKNRVYADLDSELKKVAISTFICAMFFSLGTFL